MDARRLKRNPFYKLSKEQELEIKTQNIHRQDLTTPIMRSKHNDKRRTKKRKDTVRDTLPEENMGTEIQKVHDLPKPDCKSCTGQ